MAGRVTLAWSATCVVFPWPRSSCAVYGLDQGWSRWNRLDLGVVQLAGLRPWAAGIEHAESLGSRGLNGAGDDPAVFTPTGDEDIERLLQQYPMTAAMLS
ncbi:hypothetical protein F511_32337 [Dorcoceras hygrometricum]|uniref:Uncharacterized protein n=1 Tax=Dorcoceras hygrometricum TaxID=472368 RepID=A0A2Z7CD42_9LAMI|nr:hypothetical protein F511_32337 [Dorcoceras hygrometricum]